MISLTPGFSRVVTAITYALNRFSGLPPDEKPLKRFYRDRSTSVHLAETRC